MSAVSFNANSFGSRLLLFGGYLENVFFLCWSARGALIHSIRVLSGLVRCFLVGFCGCTMRLAPRCMRAKTPLSTSSLKRGRV